MKKKIMCLPASIMLLTLASCNIPQTVNTYAVSFIGNNGLNKLSYIAPSNFAKSNENFVMSFEINYNYELNLDDIHVYIDGKENNICWSFNYFNNIKNTFTIYKEYITGPIVIDAVARYRTSTPSEYAYIFDETLENNFECYFKDHREKKFIPSFDQWAFPVMEDDIIDVVIEVDEVKHPGYSVLPDNIWFRTNARFAKINEDFFITYNEAKTKCEIHVPHYVVRDHGSFRIKQ